jgi:hypothetical protein
MAPERRSFPSLIVRLERGGIVLAYELFCGGPGATLVVRPTIAFLYSPKTI